VSDQRICPACLEPETDDEPHDMQWCAVLQINELHLAVHTRDARWQALRARLEVDAQSIYEDSAAQAEATLEHMAELEREGGGE